MVDFRDKEHTSRDPETVFEVASLDLGARTVWFLLGGSFNVRKECKARWRSQFPRMLGEAEAKGDKQRVRG